MGEVEANDAESVKENIEEAAQLAAQLAEVKPKGEENALGKPEREKSTEEALKFVCGYCNKSFKSSAYLKAHVNGMHERKTIYKCQKCKHSSCWKTSTLL